MRQMHRVLGLREELIPFTESFIHGPSLAVTLPVTPPHLLHVDAFMGLLNREWATHDVQVRSPSHNTYSDVASQIKSLMLMSTQPTSPHAANQKSAKSSHNLLDQVKHY